MWNKSQPPLDQETVNGRGARIQEGAVTSRGAESVWGGAEVTSAHFSGQLFGLRSSADNPILYSLQL